MYLKMEKRNLNKINQELELLFPTEASKLSEISSEQSLFSKDSILCILLEFKKRSPVEYVEVIVDQYYEIMESPNFRSSEKRIGSMDHVDDFIIEYPDKKNSERDEWAGFDSNNEPYRKLDDL